MDNTQGSFGGGLGALGDVKHFDTLDLCNIQS